MRRCEKLGSLHSANPKGQLHFLCFCCCSSNLISIHAPRTAGARPSSHRAKDNWNLNAEGGFVRYVGVALCFVGVALRCEGAIIGCRVLCVFLASDEGMAGRKAQLGWTIRNRFIIHYCRGTWAHDAACAVWPTQLSELQLAHAARWRWSVAANPLSVRTA